MSPCAEFMWNRHNGVGSSCESKHPCVTAGTGGRGCLCSDCCSTQLLSPPGLGRSDIQIPVLEYGRTQPVWQEGFSQLSHQLEPPSHAVVMKPWDEVPVIPKNVCVWHRGVQGITQLVECAAGGAVTWLLYGLQISASSPPK